MAAASNTVEGGYVRDIIEQAIQRMEALARQMEGEAKQALMLSETPLKHHNRLLGKAEAYQCAADALRRQLAEYDKTQRLEYLASYGTDTEAKKRKLEEYERFMERHP